MAILAELSFRACVDSEDSDDYRPRSSWAVAADPESSPGSFVERSSVVIDRVALGERVPLHTHPIDEVVVVDGASAELRLGDETRTVPPGAVMFVPRGVPHGGGPVDAEVTFIGFFTETVIETTYLERNPAPGTEGQPPLARGILDVRAVAGSRAERTPDPPDPAMS
jgi:quercetin dioxygenase-like cupin family protein